MSEVSVEQLFDEFALAYTRGERPDVQAALDRAGPERDELAAMIDGFLQAMPAREPSEEEIVLLQARLEQAPPLLLLRNRRKLSRPEVVNALVTVLGLDPARREKVHGYYHELETGLLDPEPVDSSVWDALSDVLRANARSLAAGFRPPRLAAEPAHRRADEGFVLPEGMSAGPPAQPGSAPDEVDRLFTGNA